MRAGGVKTGWPLAGWVGVSARMSHAISLPRIGPAGVQGGVLTTASTGAILRKGVGFAMESRLALLAERNRVMIEINGRKQAVQHGLVDAAELYRLADCGEDRLFLNRPDDIDIPISPSDNLIVHGGEAFVTGGGDVEDNPPLRNPIRPRFNGGEGPALATAKITGRELRASDPEIPQGRLFADIEDGVDAEIPDEMTVVVQDTDSFFVIPAGDTPEDDPAVDIENCGKHGRRPPKGHRYRIRVDREKYVVPTADIAGADVLALVSKTPEEWSLNQKMHGGRRIRIRPDEIVDLAQPGIERFETVRRQAQQGHD